MVCQLFNGMVLLRDFLVKNGKELMVKNKAEDGIITEKVVCGRSLAWLGHQVPNLTTRVQIPVTALFEA